MRHQYNFNPQTASKLLELNKLLTQSLKLESVLQNVIAAASELIEIADTFIVYLYDESADKLKLAEGKGIHEESLKKVAFDPGESIAGKVFRDREPKLFTSEQEIDRYMSNMSKVNYRYYYKGVYKQKIKSAFCVPILNRNRCLGVLVVDNFKENGIFAEEDMQVIRVVAEQSAIAIENSNVYHNLKEKNDLLAQSISIHTKYYRLMGG
ncbi:GAF domain-containing protein [Lentibacillus halodurans]|uniref:GAF domain-containing protein n=1 Tax=Lentibacillus halodurans TaxID=237679 RepID=A0A1I0XPI6_9BACI|nr:GAF domain-containing protein [Lentibacillus halodurans]SFB02200.1 GAF domain-containing protein [Lentibacillus halodurans]